MRLLDRYLLRELLVPLAYCLGGFLIFWIAFDLFSELDEFQRHQLSAADIVRYYLFRVPEFLAIVVPVALLLALLYALTHLSRHQELTAMRAAGWSLWRIARPYFAVGVIASLGLFAVSEWLAPHAAQRAEELLRDRRNPVGDWIQNLNFQNARDGRIWRIGAYHRTRHEMVNVHVDMDRPDGSSRRLIASSAHWSGRAWVFSNVVDFVRAPASELPTQRQELSLTLPELAETPDRIESEIRISRLNNRRDAIRAPLSLSELRHYLEWHPGLRAQDRLPLETMLHSRIAMPWTCLVVVFIALPFGAPSGRRNVAAGVAASILICFLFYVLRELGLALGAGGYLPPPLAAWFAHALFATLGIVLTSRVR